jgi:adenosine deaminase
MRRASRLHCAPMDQSSDNRKPGPTSGPLADLHRHLDGSLRPETLRELAGRLGVAVPENLLFCPGMGLAGALERFAVTLAVLQRPESVRRVASEICEDAAREGVSTLEIRFAPQLHREARPEAVVDAASEGAAGRAGLILCGLYGEPPDVLERLVDIARARPAVVGIDLAGGPHGGHSFGMQDYARAYGRARDLGLGRTVHAGEGRPPAEIRVAIELLHAQRIGHGTTLLQAPSVVDLVLERQVTLEACPTSNVHTGVLGEIREHPLAQWLRLGVRACVCTDNTLFSATSAPEEHRRVRSIRGMDDGLLRIAVACGHASAFRRG